MVTSRWKQPFHDVRRMAARNWLRLFPRINVVGVTGSFGKTNTSRAISEVLSQKAPVLQTDLNLDTVYNLPITILKVRPKHEFLILELGVDHQGEMASYLKLIKPKIGVVTGITPVHSDPELLGSLAGIIGEKGKLLEALSEDGLAILNRDDVNVRKMANKTRAKIVWFSLEEKSDFWADEIKVDFSGTSFKIHHGNSSFQAKIGLIGRHFVLDSLAAVAVGFIFGLKEEEIVKALSRLKPLVGRLSIEKINNTILLDDHLRANPASTLAGLETLATLPIKGRRIAVLGEMGELGSFAEEEHQKIGKAVSKLKIDFLVSVGPLQKLTAEETIKNGMKKENVFWSVDVHEAARILKEILKKGDLWYLKGSLLRHMERVIFLLNGENVDCRQMFCHYYHQCRICPQLRKQSQ